MMGMMANYLTVLVLDIRGGEESAGVEGGWEGRSVVADTDIQG